MRTVICCVSVLTTILISGCGQMGALQLPSDPKLDPRSEYLIYKNKAAATQSSATVGQVSTAVNADLQQPVSQVVFDAPAASELIEQN